MIDCSLDLCKKLNENGFNDFKQEFWWPNAGSFEVVVGAILTQNTKWERAEESLQVLREKELLSLDALANIDKKELSKYIKKSGFYKTKAKYIQLLCKAIKQEFGDFESFCEGVERDWLLAQKGVGEESCDAILNYACFKEVFVVDKYTQRLLAKAGYEFESYGEIQNWMQKGLKGWEKQYPEYSLTKLYARFHGMIVEASKKDKTYAFLEVA